MITQQASIYWDGGYLYTDSAGLAGKHLMVQKRLIAAVKKGEKTVVTPAGDELPIAYKNAK
jgi:hypothetical protein